MVEWSPYKREYGNVFIWILRAAEERRLMKKREKYRAIEKAAEKSEILDIPKVEDKKWKAVNARR